MRIRTLALAALLLGPAPALAEPYAFDLPRTNPTAFKAIRNLVPKALRGEDWIGRFDGTSGPLAEESGRLSGYVCQPHDCMANRIAFSVGKDGSRALAVIWSDEGTQGRELVLGKPAEAELEDLRRIAGRR